MTAPRRPLPQWARDASLGIFVHWGPYSVPAWAEPTGALGAVPDDEWFAHNAYAEWYANTIRIEGSPAAEHHARDVRRRPVRATSSTRGAPRRTTPPTGRGSSARSAPTTSCRRRSTTTASRSGTRPGSGDLTTVARGPRRDLIAPLADAVRAEGLRFGVYYSGGLDWAFTDLPPHRSSDDVAALRPTDAAYAAYAYAHVADLVDRYRPDLIWNDIDWPDAGKAPGPHSIESLLAHYRDGRARGHRERPLGRRRVGLPHERVRRAHPARGGCRLGALPRPRLLVRLQPRRGRVAHALAPRARAALRRRRLARRTPAAQRRADRGGRDPRRAAPHPRGRRRRG